MSTKEHKFNGKPMSHWERMGKKLVVDSLVRASFNVDTNSLPGAKAYFRLDELARAEDLELYNEVMAERNAFLEGVGRAMAAVTARGCRSKRVRKGK